MPYVTTEKRGSKFVGIIRGDDNSTITTTLPTKHRRTARYRAERSLAMRDSITPSKTACPDDWAIHDRLSDEIANSGDC